MLRLEISMPKIIRMINPSISPPLLCARWLFLCDLFRLTLLSKLLLVFLPSLFEQVLCLRSVLPVGLEGMWFFSDSHSTLAHFGERFPSFTTRVLCKPVSVYFA